MPGHGLDTRSQTESECSKQKLKLELLRGSSPKLESLPVRVVVHEHLIRAGSFFFGTATRRTLLRLHQQFCQALFTTVEQIQAIRASVRGYTTVLGDPRSPLVAMVI